MVLAVSTCSNSACVAPFNLLSLLSLLGSLLSLLLSLICGCDYSFFISLVYFIIFVFFIIMAVYIIIVSISSEFTSKFIQNSITTI